MFPIYRKHKKIEEAISKTTQLKTDNEKINLIIIIIKELKEQNKYKEAISLAKEHSLNKLANQILKEATISLAKKGFYVRSLINLRKITHPYEKKEIIDKISNILRLENNKKKAQNIAIRLSKLIPELFPKSKRYILKSNIFLSIGKFNSASKALIKSLKSKEKISLVDEEMHFFYFQNKFKASDAISKYSYIIDKEEDAISKIRALISLSDRLNKIGNIENSIKFAEKALELARSNSFDYLSNLFEEISILYAKNDMIELSLEIIKEFKLERFEKDEIFSQISLHLMSKNKFNDAYRFSKKISTPITRDDITFSIISNQTTLNELNQALKKTKLINDKGKRIQAKAKIAAKFAIQGNKNQSTKLITEIDQSTNELHYITDEILSLVKASKEFEMENQIIVSEYFFSKAMNFINDISNESKKIDILKDVYSEIASLKNIHSVENIFTKTHSIAARQNSFKNLAHKFINDYGIQESLKISDKFNFEESKTHYLKGCVKHVNSNQVDQNTAQKALPYLIHDSESLEIVLQKHALHETFLGNSTQEQLERLNQTLNIQWALDIVATFPKDEENADFSIN